MAATRNLRLWHLAVFKIADGGELRAEEEEVAGVAESISGEGSRGNGGMREVFVSSFLNHKHV